MPLDIRFTSEALVELHHESIQTTLERCPRLTTWRSYRIMELVPARDTSCVGVVEDSRLKERDGR